MADSFESISFKDDHTVFITDLDNATEEQLNSALEEFFENCNGVLPEPVAWGKWHINVVKSKGKCIGIAYVFFENPIAFYIIIGKNPDGTFKIREADPGEYDDEQVIDVWGMTEAEKEKYKVPEGKVAVIDSELITDFPTIKLIGEDGKSFLAFPTIVGCLAILKLEQYNKIVPNELFTQLYENNWITSEMIKERFLCFCSTEQSKKSLRVDINDGKVVVKFKDGCFDAHFALKMNMKMSFVSPAGEHVTIFFDYRKKFYHNDDAKRGGNDRGRGSRGGGRGNNRGRGGRGRGGDRDEDRNGYYSKKYDNDPYDEGNYNWRKR